MNTYAKELTAIALTWGFLFALAFMLAGCASHDNAGDLWRVVQYNDQQRGK